MEARPSGARGSMPVYDFECSGCGRTCEILVRTGDKKPRCPSCGSAKLKKSFSAPSIITRGGGGTKVKTSASRSGCSRSSCGGCSGCH